MHATTTKRVGAPSLTTTAGQTWTLLFCPVPSCPVMRCLCELVCLGVPCKPNQSDTQTCPALSKCNEAHCACGPSHSSLVPSPCTASVFATALSNSTSAAMRQRELNSFAARQVDGSANISHAPTQMRFWLISPGSRQSIIPKSQVLGNEE